MCEEVWMVMMFDDDDPERCPWCGAKAEPEVGVGNHTNIVRYELWLEDHVLDCEPYLKEEEGS